MNILLTKHLGRQVLLLPEVLRKSQPLVLQSQPLFSVSGQRYSVLAQHIQSLKRSCWSSTTYKFFDGQVVRHRSIATTPKEDFNAYLPKKKINIEDKINSRRFPRTQRGEPPMFWRPPTGRPEVHNLKRTIVKPKPTTRRLSNILDWYPTGV